MCAGLENELQLAADKSKRAINQKDVEIERLDREVERKTNDVVALEATIQSKNHEIEDLKRRLAGLTTLVVADKTVFLLSSLAHHFFVHFQALPSNPAFCLTFSCE